MDGISRTERKKVVRCSPAALTGLGGVLICALALLPLFDVRSTFYVDWFNHLWLIQYFGKYMGLHFFPPEMISTASLIGNPMPIFYSPRFYAFNSLLSYWIGAGGLFASSPFVHWQSNFITWKELRAGYI